MVKKKKEEEGERDATRAAGTKTGDSRGSKIAEDLPH